ncbi:hypothetical protein KIW84_031346 [Lathyrus oleraceus]|uniref:Purple acid phosphatase N-terminal domain-containing protein n=1 Tax=Pisum sativum TaxID=3888 RepID=A0A9D4XQZ0_PEA|nr:hypothetical protein KIW84_031346 [Pisum sativum]
MAIKGTHFPFLTLLVAIIFTEYLRFNVVHGYNRPPPRKTIFTFHKDNDSAPQQVHISQVGQDKMRISWIAESPTLAKVEYNQILSKNKISATGTTSSYRYLIYNYGEIHNVVIGPLKPNNAYHYGLGESPKTYNFKTAPDQFPIKFAIVGMRIPPNTVPLVGLITGCLWLTRRGSRLLSGWNFGFGLRRVRKEYGDHNFFHKTRES